MRHALAMASVALLLSACDHFQEDAQVASAQAKADATQITDNAAQNWQRMADNMRDSIKRTNNKVREWWITPLPEKQKRAVASSYCYHALQDILCYRQPMPGWESRLVAYQGTNALPPPPSVTEPLHTQIYNAAEAPVNRVATIQPVFVDLPPGVKVTEKEGASAAPPAPDASHVGLPDPALAPQL